jgi:hypothetical protein
MLGVDETDLWPQLRTTRTRPDEVVAIYPHRDAVPRDVWLRLFGSGQYEIGILDCADMPVAADPAIAAVLAERARSGVKIRICLHDTNQWTGAEGAVCPDSGHTPEVGLREALFYAPLRATGDVQIRLHRGVVYNSMYYADDQMLVGQHVYGIPIKVRPRASPATRRRRRHGRSLQRGIRDCLGCCRPDSVNADSVDAGHRCG